MIKKVLAPIVLLASLFTPSVASAQQSCQFVLGFADMAAAVPQVGQCKENQHFAPNGDAQQATTGGLLVWRKADNWTAFTDGSSTWLNGPRGIESRLNTQRFSWEGAQPIVILDQSGSGPNQTATFTVPQDWDMTLTYTCPSTVGCAVYAFPHAVSPTHFYTQASADGMGGTTKVHNHDGGAIYIEMILGPSVPWHLVVTAPGATIP